MLHLKTYTIKKDYEKTNNRHRRHNRLWSPGYDSESPLGASDKHNNDDDIIGNSQ